MGVNEELLSAMAEGGSVDGINPIGNTGKMLKAIAKGESGDNITPVGIFCTLLKDSSAEVAPSGVNGKMLKAKLNGESVEDFHPVGAFGELLKVVDIGGGGGTYADEVYKYYGVDKSEYPFFFIQLESNMTCYMIFCDEMYISSNRLNLKNYKIFRASCNRTITASNAYEMYEMTKITIPVETAIETTGSSTNRTCLPACFYATNNYEVAYPLFGNGVPQGFIDMNVPVE